MWRPTAREGWRRYPTSKHYYRCFILFFFPALHVDVVHNLHRVSGDLWPLHDRQDCEWHGTWWSNDKTRYDYSLTSACGTRAGTSRPTSSTGAASSSTPSSTSSARRSTRFVLMVVPTYCLTYFLSGCNHAHKE